MSVARARALVLCSLLLSGCATTRTQDLEERASRTVAGFAEANVFVADLLEGAAAWAVFSIVEDASADCRHDGVLFQAGKTRQVHLRCRARPQAPGGLVYHQLVILMDPNDVARLDRAPLDLSDAARVAPYDTYEGGAEPTPRWVVETRPETLLFEPPELVQHLELASPPPGSR